MKAAPGQALKKLTVLPVPNPHFSVGSRRDESAVGTECNGIRGPKLASFIALFRPDCLARRCQVPDMQFRVRAAGGQVPAIGVERDADDCILVCAEGLDFLAR